MKSKTSIMKISVILVIISVSISCEKNVAQFQDEGSDILQVIIPQPAISKAVDEATPVNVQPYFIGTNGQPVANFVTDKAPNGYKIIFSDEFNTTTLNPDKWNIINSPKSRSSRPDKGISSWFWKPELVSVNGSDLILSASKTNSNTMFCGSIDSKAKFEPKYGYLEAKITVADIKKAVHTAFWSTGTNQGVVDGTGNDGCEVDIFESAYSNGKQTQTALHWDGYGAAAKGWTKHWGNAGDFGADIHSGYHIFAMEWDETALVIYYDGKRMFTYTGVGVPLVQQYLWLSVGASFGDGEFISKPIGNLTDAKVDWVRVYEKK